MKVLNSTEICQALNWPKCVMSRLIGEGDMKPVATIGQERLWSATQFLGLSMYHGLVNGGVTQDKAKEVRNYLGRMSRETLEAFLQRGSCHIVVFGVTPLVQLCRREEISEALDRAEQEGIATAFINVRPLWKSSLDHVEKVGRDLAALKEGKVSA